MSTHKIHVTFGGAGPNSVPKYQAQCTCLWWGKRLNDATAATIDGEKHIAAEHGPKLPTQHPRYPQALWYAWGQHDAGAGLEADPFAFAWHHAQAAIRADEGKTSHLPSIQAAWKLYVEEVRSSTLSHTDGVR